MTASSSGASWVNECRAWVKKVTVETYGLYPALIESVLDFLELAIRGRSLLTEMLHVRLGSLWLVKAAEFDFALMLLVLQTVVLDYDKSLGSDKAWHLSGGPDHVERFMEYANGHRAWRWITSQVALPNLELVPHPVDIEESIETWLQETSVSKGLLLKYYCGRGRNESREHAVFVDSYLVSLGESPNDWRTDVRGVQRGATRIYRNLPSGRVIALRIATRLGETGYGVYLIEYTRTSTPKVMGTSLVQGYVQDDWRSTLYSTPTEIIMSDDWVAAFGELAPSTRPSDLVNRVIWALPIMGMAQFLEQFFGILSSHRGRGATMRFVSHSGADTRTVVENQGERVRMRYVYVSESLVSQLLIHERTSRRQIAKHLVDNPDVCLSDEYIDTPLQMNTPTVTVSASRSPDMMNFDMEGLAQEGDYYVHSYNMGYFGSESGLQSELSAIWSYMTMNPSVATDSMSQLMRYIFDLAEGGSEEAFREVLRQFSAYVHIQPTDTSFPYSMEDIYKYIKVLRFSGNSAVANFVTELTMEEFQGAVRAVYGGMLAFY